MKWLNCGITTQAIWPQEKKEVKYGEHTFILLPLTKKHSASIHINVQGINNVEGMTLINRFLSALGWKDNQPAINHYGSSGNPIPVPVQKYRIPYGYSPSQYFPDEIFEITNKKAKLAISLYREGKSLNSIPFQFLSYFKILNIFWNDKFNKKIGENDLVHGVKKNIKTLKR